MGVRLVVRHRNGERGEAAGDLQFEFEQARIVIGRSAGADVRLPSAAVSDTHATLERRGSYYALRDERSLNGTAVNGIALVPERPRALADGDEIAIAEFTLRFSAAGVLGPSTTPERTASLARRMLRELLGQEHAASEPPYLLVTEGADRGRRFDLQRAPARVIIGRGSEAQLVLDDADVSRAHVEIDHAEDATIARDLASKNGFEVNGKPTRERRLKHGDVLRIGSTELCYRDPAEQALRALEQQPVVTLTRTRPEVARAEVRSQSVAPDMPAAVTAAGEVEASEPDSGPPHSLVDYAVYLLAAVILAASLAGMFWLLH